MVTQPPRELTFAEKVAAQARGGAVDVMLNNPTIAGVADKVLGVELRSFGDMLTFYSKDDPDLKKRITTLCEEPAYKEIFDKIRSSCEQSIKAGDLKDWEDAIKKHGLSSDAINKNLAEKIAFISTSNIKSAVPSDMTNLGNSISDLAGKAFKKWNEASFSKDPLEWISSLVGGALEFAKGVIYQPGVKENAKRLAKDEIVAKKDEIALKVGGDLSMSNVPDSVKKTVMIEMWVQLSKEGNPQFTISDADKAKKADELIAALPKAHATRVRAGAADVRAPEVAEAAKPQAAPDESNLGYVEKKLAQFGRWASSSDEYQNASGIKGHVYNADPEKEFGIKGTWNQVMIGLATGVAMTKKGELLALQEGIMKYNPKAIITFHGADGKPFNVANESNYPDTIVVGVSKTKDEKANYYYFREPGLSVTNAMEAAKDTALAVVGTKGLGGLATKLTASASRIPVIGKVLGGATAEGATALNVVGRTTAAVGGTASAYYGLDILSKAASGQNLSDASVGEAIYAGLMDKAALSTGAWAAKKVHLDEALSKVTKTELGQIWKNITTGKPIPPEVSGHISSESITTIKTGMLAYAQQHSIKTALLATATTGTAMMAFGQASSPDGTPPSPMATPAVALDAGMPAPGSRLN